MKRIEWRKIALNIVILTAVAIGVAYGLLCGMEKEVGRRCWVARQNCIDHPEYCHHEYIDMCNELEKEQ